MAGRSGARDLGADRGGIGIAAIAEAHRGEEGGRSLEAEIAVRHRADIADVGRHHGIGRHRLLQLAQRPARRDRAAVGLAPAVELGLPVGLLRADLGQALLACAMRGDRPVAGLEAGQKLGGGGARIAADADRRLLDQPELARIESTWISLASFGQ